MKRLLILALVAWMTVGCGANSITVFKLVDGEPVPVVQVDQHFAGKGCIAVDSDIEGNASVIVQQAGTSDWSLSRLGGFLGDTVGAVFGGSRSMGEMQGPAEGMQGCEGLFGEEVETMIYEPEPLPDPLTYRVTPVQ